MEKILNRNQVKIIMVLNIVLVVLFVGVFLTFKSNGVTDTGTAAPPPPPHNIIRAARLSANGALSYETNIGGSGEETLINVFDRYNRLYIFGNTTSTDYDFVSKNGGGFMSQLTYGGNTKSFQIFPFNVVKAIPLPDGFAILGNEGNSSVLHIINSDGVSLNSIVISNQQKAIDLFIYDNSYMAVTESFNETLNRTTLFVTAYSSALTKQYERKFSRGFSYNYVTILPYKNSFALVANLTGDTTCFASFAIFNKDEMPTNKDISLNYNYILKSITPYSGGYALMIDNATKPEIVLVNKDFALALTKHFPEIQSEKFNLFFNNGEYFTFLSPTHAKTKLYKLSDDFNSENEVALSDDFTDILSCAYNKSAGFIMGKTSETLKVLALSNIGENMGVTFASNSETNAKILPLSDSLIMVCESTKKSADVGGNFGGSDIWITKIPLTNFFIEA